MSGVKKYDYSTLTAAIRSYTEVDSDVFTQAVIDEFIMAAEFRIYQELPMDSQRFVQEGTLSTDNNTINNPAGTLFIRGDEAEISWKLLSPILDEWTGKETVGLETYSSGTWGPLAADKMLLARGHEWITGKHYK